MKAHSAVKGVSRRYLFACRDTETGGLKPVSKNGSRRRYCRHCPALKAQAVCLFGARAARDKLVLLKLATRDRANWLTGLCACGAPCADGFEHCRVCLQRMNTTRRASNASVPCRYPGCQKLVVTRHSRTGYCVQHARWTRWLRRADARPALEPPAPGGA